MSFHLQRISLRFEYPVYFTHDVFAPGNTALAEALAWHEPGRRHRVLVVVDRGVADAWPALAKAIVEYAGSTMSASETVSSPLVIEGGGREERPGAAPLSSD